MAEEAAKRIPPTVPADRKEKALAALREYEQVGTAEAEFPVLRIDGQTGELSARGRFAELQVAYVHPPAAAVAALAEELRARKVGVVAHFYMDAELQGLLQSCAASWPHVFVADSLAMGDAAARMAAAGMRAVLVLGVDFMAENVRAVLNAAGHSAVPVYRLATEPVGCSLAAAADAPEYTAWLRKARDTSAAAGHAAVHVVYINTSLAAKAAAQSVMPTVSCTSSNVVRTIQQLEAQIPATLDVWYGPDAYMGANLKRLFDVTAPGSGAAERLRWYERGYCVIHNIFGADIVARAKELLAQHGPSEEVFPTAHLEVPGEMFELAYSAQTHGRGVVGSTSDILAFIARTVESATQVANAHKTLRFLLGTESGMATSVVRKVQSLLADGKNAAGGVEGVEIVFPVSRQAVAPTGEADIPVVPGVCSGEGCSAAGGCASCPFMKMNTLAGLRYVLARIGTPDEAMVLAGYRPREYPPEVTDQGVRPIAAMRHFQMHQRFSDDFVASVLETLPRK